MTYLFFSAWDDFTGFYQEKTFFVGKSLDDKIFPIVLQAFLLKHRCWWVEDSVVTLVAAY